MKYTPQAPTAAGPSRPRVPQRHPDPQRQSEQPAPPPTAQQAIAASTPADPDQNAHELEQARPSRLARLPDLLKLETASHTRTPPGGSGIFFDCFSSGRETLTFIFGDATGRDFRPGLTGSVVKNLLSRYHASPDLAEGLRQMSAALRDAELSGPMVSLALGRMRGHVLELAGDGMPPALVQRADTGLIDELPFGNIRLADPAGPDYHVHRLSLCPGDTLVLMSNGLADLGSECGETSAYRRAVNELEAAPGLAPDDIVAHLVDLLEGGASSSASECGPFDDVHLVVLQLHALPPARPENETADDDPPFMCRSGVS